MDWLRALIDILVVIAVAGLIGWTQVKEKRPVVQFSVYVGSILVLLALRVGLTRTWELSLLLLAIVLHGLDRIPFWFVCVAKHLQAALREHLASCKRPGS